MFTVAHHTPIGPFHRAFTDSELMYILRNKASHVWFGPYGDLAFRCGEAWFVCK